ncbi:MAG: MAPEG family protein [Hyphomicrobium sp.]
MQTDILFPVFVQVGLTYALQLLMGKERLAAFRAGTVKRGESPGARPVWPERAAVTSNAFHNQLEMPILFYAVVAFALITNAADGIMIVLAWLFVALRIAQAGIHVTYNHIPHRFLAYFAGSMVLLAMWVRLALHVLTAAV